MGKSYIVNALGVTEGILDRIINNKYSIEVKGRISMRKRHVFSEEESEVNGND